MELFRVRLNCVDHYQATPTSYDPLLRRNVSASQRQNEPRVPVIRVFGSTETGQKVCAHIHGALPYLYVEYGGNLAPDEVGTYIHQLHLSIDHALAVSYRRNAYDGQNKYVGRITLVKGVPFYGYQVGYRYFLKIYMLNPMVMVRLSDLLRQGVVMKKVFQPFEAHLQYLLQWMADYNLYGCGYIDCRNAYFRGPVPKFEDVEDLCHLWHDRSIPSRYILGEGVLPRVSHCSIEVDICSQDILNRTEIRPRLLHHDFVELQNPVSPQEKLVHSMAGLWRDETRRRKLKMVDPDPGSSPFPADVLISMSAETRNSQRGGWIHEEEFMDNIRSLILEEKNRSNGENISFQSYVHSSPFESFVKTALESVEDLYPENLGPALGLKFEKSEPESLKTHGDQVVAVDVDGVARAVGKDFSYEFDEECFSAKVSPEETEALIEENCLASYDLLDDSPESNADLGSENYSRNGNSHTNKNRTTPIHTISGRNDTYFNLAPRDLYGAEDLKSAIGVKRSASGSPAEIAVDKRHRTGWQLPNSEGLAPSTPKILQRDESPAKEPYMSNNTRAAEEMKLHESYRSGLATSPTTVKSFQTSVTINPQNQSTQETLKGYGREATKSLGFPVVKDPQEPSTILRLSQGNQSQKSSDASSRKIVLFDLPPQLDMSSKHANSLGTSSLSSSESDQVRLATSLLSNLKSYFPQSAGSKSAALFSEPPHAMDVASTMPDFNLPSVIYQDAYFNDESDVPERAREWAGREFKLESLTVPFLADFDPTGTSPATYGAKPGIVVDKAKDEAIFKKRRRVCSIRSWEFGEPPPTVEEVVVWLNDNTTSKTSTALKPTQVAESPKEMNKLSQIEGPTQKNRNSTRYTEQQNTTSVQHEVQYMSTMSLEIHVNTRGSFVPNPEEDEVQCIFWCLQSDDDEFKSGNVAQGSHVGVVSLSQDGEMSRKIARQLAVEIYEESTELDLLVRMVEIVRTHDPDILTGFEVHGGSWGYLIERARLKYDYNLCDEFSRMKSQSFGRFGKENDKWGFNHTSTIRVTGRHMINIWRAMRGELNLLQYTIENIAYHLLQRRTPHYSWKDLTHWYSNGRPRDLAKVLKYYVSRVRLDLEILERNELIPRTSEQARLLGVDFFSVFSRGSQFKVESLMFRIAKPENFILVSPSRKQIGGQNALECLPLVMEPQSAFYSSPLLVLDFQSLYPSVMIAYNYCYSTFLGRIVDWRGINKMGFTEYKRQDRLLELLQDHINIAPNGMMYVKPEIRKSLLAKMLGEILETRVMVKSGMKADKEDQILQSLLNNRQLALKLIANVTYGYTSASFSGRMPCSEIADSIVQTARETLERTIALIHSVQRWGAEVVYGDTDSLFIYLKGRSKDQAFEIGDEIAKLVTNKNPRPIKLKFEKVYFPCVLLAKKRYVGFKYESKDQKEPEFDAKGIETVRRDGTPAEQKIEEKALKILFRSADLSQVKSYFQKQCEKIMRGSVSIQDFCFAKEVRLGTYSEKGLPPPGALISTRRMLQDSRAEPQYGERVPYVVITGAPGARLIDRCVAPEALLESDHNELDAEYYISKNIIPPLERIFNLVGANVRNWYDEMPKVQRIRRVDVPLPHGQAGRLQISKATLESYMKSSSCLVCRGKLESDGPICETCQANRPVSLLALRTGLNRVEKKCQDLERVCQSCSGIPLLDEVLCDSKDCPVFYTRTKQKMLLRRERAIVEPLMRILQSGEGLEPLGW